MSKKQKPDSVISTQRLEAFSDGIFAIVITLLFLELHVPTIPNNADWSELLTAILSLSPTFFSIFISFSFVAVFWISHHQFFRTLQETTRGLLLLNIVFLFLVCFVPFPAAIMSRYPFNKTAVIFFGVTVAPASLLLVTLRWYAWVKRPELSGINDDEAIRKAINHGLLMIAGYCTGIIVSFFYPPAAVVIYLLTPLMLLFPVKVEVETEDEKGQQETSEIVL